MLNIYHIEPSNYVNGKGNRYVIWVQGCNLGCKECWNKQTWSMKTKKLISCHSLFEDIKQQPNIDGVTFSGGEPLLQADNLLELAILIKETTTLDLHIFTGFELSEIVNNNQKKLLDLADTIVAGRFNPNKYNNNQKVYRSEFSDWIFNNSDVEIELDENGDILITGYPTNELIKSIKEIKE
jgi:anaerobic ribonucleoside-triphosphate reductase activating protein